MIKLRRAAVVGNVMFSFLKGKVSVLVANEAKKGNALAQRLVAHETKRFLETLPMQSPLVRGDYMIPDSDRPLPEDMRGGMMGDYEMKPLAHKPATPEALLGRTIRNVEVNIGSYGMGGYGFFGLDLGEEWFIVPIHGSGEWITLDGRLLERFDGKSAWIVEGNDGPVIDRLVGATLTGAEFRRTTMRISFDNGAELCIDEDPATRPKLAGTGQPRAFLDGDDLAGALFLSPSPEIFV